MPRHNEFFNSEMPDIIGFMHRHFCGRAAAWQPGHKLFKCLDDRLGERDMMFVVHLYFKFENTR